MEPKVKNPQNPFSFSFPAREELTSRIIRQAGYPNLNSAASEILAELQDVVKLLPSLLEPVSLYKTTPYLNSKKGALTGGDISIRSKKISAFAKLLIEPEIIFCFIISLGKKLDMYISKTHDKKPLQSYFLNIAGSILAESMAQQYEEYLLKIASAQGYMLTLRFSPGYCDWNIEDGQREMFFILKPDSCGISLTDGGMMDPLKSITALLIGARDVPDRAQCIICDDSTCAHRRAQYKHK